MKSVPIASNKMIVTNGQELKHWPQPAILRCQAICVTGKPSPGGKPVGVRGLRRCPCTLLFRQGTFGHFYEFTRACLSLRDKRVKGEKVNAGEALHPFHAFHARLSVSNVPFTNRPPSRWNFDTVDAIQSHQEIESAILSVTPTLPQYFIEIIVCLWT